MLETFLNGLGTFGSGAAGAALVMGVVSLIRGRSTDRRDDGDAEAKLIEMVQKMAKDALEAANLEVVGLRSEVATVRLESATLRSEVDHLNLAATNESIERAFMVEERQRLIDALNVMYEWGDAGSPPPPPGRPSWVGRDSPVAASH